MEKDCLAGDALACDGSSSVLDSGRFLGIQDRRRARRLAELGCKLGSADACDRIAADLAVTVEDPPPRYHRDSLWYFLLACEAPSDENRRIAACEKSALETYLSNHPDVEARDAESKKDYARVSFNALVVSCGTLFDYLGGGAFVCEAVKALCADPKFVARNKKEWCPKVAKAEARYLAAKKAGLKWPPESERKGYEIPSCQRFRSSGQKVHGP